MPVQLLATTFNVTSNADSGTGTLREALTLAAANGKASVDYIYFNIPDITESGRTIILQSQLPDVSPNLVIDGSTQPGLPFGVSDARVCITIVRPTAGVSAFNITLQTVATDIVEFFGLYIRGFYDGANITGNAIYARSSCQLMVGTQGKGNLIHSCHLGVAGVDLRGAKIQYNIMNLAPDGFSPMPNYNSISSGGIPDNLLIDHNTFAIGKGSTINLFLSSAAGNAAIIIQNNRFGTDFTGTRSVFPAGGYAGAAVNINGPVGVSIFQNVFSAEVNGINISNSARPVVKGNFFGTDATQTFALGTKSGTFALVGTAYAAGVIGGDAAADQNIFANYNNPFSLTTFAYLKIIKNKFYCNNNVVLPLGTAAMVNNYIRITKLFSNSISGEAPSGAVVQLYYTDYTQCPNCNPTNWFAQVTANASGTWTYNGTLLSNVMVSSTLGDYTVGFEPNFITDDEVTVTHIDCNTAGSLELKTKREGNFQFAWRDANGALVSSTQKADNLKAGVYTLDVTVAGGCPSATGKFTITDSSPKIAPQTFQTDCTNTLGRFVIADVASKGIASYNWTNAAGTPIAGNAIINNLPVGDYYLYIIDGAGCKSPTEKFQVLPPVGLPVIDESSAQTQPSACGTNTGSVTGIKVSGYTAVAGNYGWITADGTQTYYDRYDLSNVAAGQYYFFINYSGACVVKSKTYTVTENNGITINDTQKTIGRATCANNDGRIIGILAPGATSYKWVDGTGKTVSTSLNLNGAPVGNYYLVASNSTCSKQSPTYTITQQDNLISIGGTTKILKDATCGLNNGSIEASLQEVIVAPVAYRWQNSAGQTVGSNSLTLTGLDAGTYTLYGTDANGCERLLIPYSIGRVASVQLDDSQLQTVDDGCEQAAGSIKGMKVTGGAAPATYSWLNASGQQVGNAVDLTGVTEGTYIFHAKDAAGCEVISQAYTIQNQTQIVAAPSLNDVQLCTSGSALLQVSNTANGYKYRIYDTQTALTPLDEQSSGTLKVSVYANRSFYVSQLAGTCESNRTEVKVSVGLSAISMANTFSPNGDGMNDTWVLKGMENYPAALVQIFNRYGQKVFESRGYSAPFNGTMNANLLPAGAYYYIINLGGNCNLLSGSLTLMR